LAVCIGVVAVAAVSLLAASWAGAQSKAAAYPRADSLITSGTQWGNISGFNPYVGNYAAGMVGLNNETLLRYDPLQDKYIPWLAKSAEFTSANVFKIKVRPGIKWSNGTSFSAKDVGFNLSLLRFPTSTWHTMWCKLEVLTGPADAKKPPKCTNKPISIKVKGSTVTVKWPNRAPNYSQWMNAMYNIPMMSSVQYAKVDDTTLTTVTVVPLGTGAYTLDSAGYDPTTRVVWKRKGSWWAAKAKIAPMPAPLYIIDLCNTSNTNALSGLLTAIEDLNNNYLPGIQGLVSSGKAQTYFPGKPYDLSANTAWLEINTTKAGLNDAAFRKALATSVNVGNIVNNDYGNLVLPANSTGLLGIWKKWVDQKQLKKLGFKFSTSNAKSMLAAAGYKDVNSDGWVETKSGDKLQLKIAVPQGWSDWESARDMIVASAQAAGIHMVKDEGDFNHWQSERNLGKFDTVVDNNYQISDNPWTYYNGIFNLPVIKTGTGQTFANFGRYENATAWSLVKQLDTTPFSNVSKRKSIMKKLQKISMTNMPIIPLWYNGVWAQTQSKYWKNWPSSTSKRNYIPCMWRGYLQMTGIDMFTHVKKA
jgi:peptide/nickel transport system substrate-binding protein